VAVPPFLPEYVKDVELGVKSDWSVRDIWLRTNADIYFQNYTDIQTLESVLLPYPAVLTGNGGRARIWGTELAALAQLTRDFELGLTFDFLNFRYLEFSPATPSFFVKALEAPTNAGRVPYKYTVNASYHLPFDPHIGNISLKAHWAWQAEQSIDTDVRGAPGSVVPEFGILNLAVDWNGIVDSSVDLQLYATNALNKTYATGAGFEQYYSAGNSATIYGQPRMYGIRLRYRFGADAKK
jgi:iron complex outermembrane receptor protein